MKKILSSISIISLFAALSIMSCTPENVPGGNDDPENPDTPTEDTSSTEEPVPVKVESVLISPEYVEMLIGDETELSVTISPEDAEVGSITYTSDNPSVASVEEGLVTAVDAGSASIIVDADGIRDTCIVRVLSGNKLLSEATVGDFYLADGSLLDVNTDASTVSHSDVIGVVFSTDLNRMGEAEKQALKDKGVEPHGLVLASKHVGDITYSNMWFYDEKNQGYDRDEREIGIPYAFDPEDSYASYELSDADIDGYLYTKLIREERAEDYENGMYPIFKDAVAFNETVPAPETSTGWYLPAAGQWHDILRNLTGATLNTTSSFYEDTAGNFFWLGKGDLPELMNANFDKIDDGDKTLFDAITNQLWTSSQASANQARVIIFDNASFIHSFWYYKYFYFGARCVLGF